MSRRPKVATTPYSQLFSCYIILKADKLGIRPGDMSRLGRAMQICTHIGQYLIIAVTFKILKHTEAHIMHGWL